MLEDTEITSRYNGLYLEIILKYKEYIEGEERIYAAELPTFITPEDQAVCAVAGRIKSGFASYNYDRDFVEAAAAAHAYVKKEIYTIEIPIQFWLKPAQLIRCGSGDEIGKAMLLCSLLISLGCPSAKVIIVDSDDSKKIGVYFTFSGGLFLMRDSGPMNEFISKEEMVSDISGDRHERAYEFNNNAYLDLF